MQDRCTRPLVSAYAARHQMVPICSEWWCTEANEATQTHCYNPVALAYPIWAYYAHGQQCRCQEDPVSLPFGRLEKTTRSSPHHMAQHRPTGSETTLPYALRSSRFGSEPPSVEDDVDLWCYTFLSCMPATTTTTTWVDMSPGLTRLTWIDWLTWVDVAHLGWCGSPGWLWSEGRKTNLLLLYIGLFSFYKFCKCLKFYRNQPLCFTKHWAARVSSSCEARSCRQVVQIRNVVNVVETGEEMVLGVEIQTSESISTFRWAVDSIAMTAGYFTAWSGALISTRSISVLVSVSLCCSSDNSIIVVIAQNTERTLLILLMH